MSDLHNHNHPHPHPGQDPLPAETVFDPANQALTDALRISFVVLKLIIVCVFALFLYSGAYTVEQNEQAIVLRFGQVVGVGPEAIKEAGWHWAWPSIDEIIKIPAPTAQRSLTVERFWYYETEKEKLGEERRPPPRTLQLRDGYSLTASLSAAQTLQASAEEVRADPVTDYNVVHTKWLIRYSVSEPLAFMEHLWEGTEGDVVTKTGGWYTVQALLENILADAVIRTSANRDIEELIWGKALQFTADVQRQTRSRLKELNVGLEADLELIDIKPPRQVKAAFDQALRANLNAKTMETAAEARANEIRSEAQAQANILISQALAYQGQIVQSAQADARYLSEILAEIEQTAWQRVPETEPDYLAQRRQVYGLLMNVTVDELYQEMLRDVFAHAEETFVPPAQGSLSEWRLYLNRDATIKKAPKAEQQNIRGLLRPTAPVMPGPAGQ